MNGTIYIVQEDHSKDFSSLRIYEKNVDFLFSKGVFRDNWEEHIEKCTREAEERLANFDPEYDMIVLNGDFVLMCLVAQILGRKGHGFLVLKWDNLDREYYQVYIPSLMNKKEGDKPYDN